MRVKKIVLIAAMVLSSFPLIAQAVDMKIKNNTNSYGTARTDASPCSNAIGDSGIVTPHGTITIPTIVFDMYCPTTCSAYLFVTKNCSGQPIATLKVDHDKGVMSVTNHTKNYQVSGGGINVTIDGGK